MLLQNSVTVYYLLLLFGTADALFLLFYHHALYVPACAYKEYGFLYPASKQAHRVC